MNKIIIYDFDGTLTPLSITDFKILEKCGYVGGGNNKEVIKMVKDYMLNKDKNIYESFYHVILNILIKNNIELCDENLAYGAKHIEYNKGVNEFLEYISKNGVLNYIVSSSILSFLKEVEIANYFNKIYATTFIYDKDKIIGVDTLMTDKKKIDAIKDIVKDNDYENVIYIGDGLTDLKAMEFVKNNGGISIYVTDDINSIEESDKEYINYIFNKDYSLDGSLFKKIKEVLNI